MDSSNDEFCRSLLRGPGVREARQWLGESQRNSRSLGEGADQSDSIRFIERLYELGAMNVHAVEIESYAVEIDGETVEDQNTGKLVIELPQRRREKLFKFCGSIVSKEGFDPTADVGQQYLFLMLD